jgi:hypothetical protein
MQQAESDSDGQLILIASYASAVPSGIRGEARL